MRTVIVSGLLLFFVVAVRAGGDEKGQIYLREAADIIRNTRTFAYESVIDAVFPDGSNDRMHTRLYMDAVGKRLYYQTDNQVYLLTPQWAFQADHQAQTVGVFQVHAYQKRYRHMPALDKYFHAGMAAGFADSFLLRKAKIQSFKEEGNIVSLNIVFPERSYIRDIQLTYNRKTNLPVKLRIRTFYPDSRYPAGGGQPGGTVYDILCRNYTREVPESVFDTRRYFVVDGSRVVLKEYRSYKLSTIL